MQGNNQQNQPKRDGAGSIKSPTLSWSAPGTAAVPAQKAITPPKAPVTALMPQGYSRNGLMLSFVGGLVIGLLFGWMWFGNRGSSPVTQGNEHNTSAEEETSTSSATSGALSSGDALDILVETQKAGLSVAVSNIKVEKPTWIVVHESRNGAPGNVL